MDFSVAAVTVRVVLPEMLPEVAEIVVFPAAAAVARPAVLMLAAAGVPEAQVTSEVMFLVLLSEYVPVARYCTVVPAGVDWFAGVTAMDFRVAAVTVRTVLPETLPEVAVMVELPTASADARPPEALMLATAGVPEAQVTDPVMSLVLLSE